MSRSSSRHKRNFIAISSGPFDSSTVLSVYFLRKSGHFKDCLLVRTCDPWLVKCSRVVVNMGGIYDRKTFRYDHRARDFHETMTDRGGVLLGPAGLIYKQFQNEILTEIFESHHHPMNLHSDAARNKLGTMMYSRYVRAFDCIAHGIPFFPEGTELFFYPTTTIFTRIEMWNTMGTIEVALDAIDREFSAMLFTTHDSNFPAWPLVRAAFQSREHPQILVLDQALPYHSALNAMEMSGGSVSRIWFVVHPKLNKDEWAVETVGVSYNDRTPRKDLPFAGMEGEELRRKSGIAGAIFVHRGAFVAHFETKEQAVSFARLAARTD
jgi:uncharacterized UPF0160 family protein